MNAILELMERLNELNTSLCPSQFAAMEYGSQVLVVYTGRKSKFRPAQILCDPDAKLHTVLKAVGLLKT